MPSTQTLPEAVQSVLDDLAPVNRFSVTIYPTDPTRLATRQVEVLRQSQYDRCRSIQAEADTEGGQVVEVTGFSFQGYCEALAYARWLARQLASKSA